MKCDRAMWLTSACLSIILPVLASGQPVLERVPNTTLKLPLVPRSFGYTTEPAFGAVTFLNPVAIAVPRGETNRLFVVEQGGVIAVITNLAAPNRSVFLNLTGRLVSGGEQGLLGLAFHPGFATNGQFFVFYTLNSSTAAGNGLHDRLSRFLVSSADSNQADPASERVLFSQYDQAGNHNGGDLHFGPDGYLYVSLGDEGGANDTYANSQRIDKDFFAGILRLDVDLRPGNREPNPHPANTNSAGQFTYAIPADNPYLDITSFNGATVNPARVRTEFWAVGLRNPWRMSFDYDTGRLYVADVGQGTWEEVNLVVGGGNYGWSYREGPAAGPRGNPPAGVTFASPMLSYSHGSGPNQGYSITGGVVYRGSRLSGLYDAYVFADYVSGNVWATRYTGTNNPSFWRLTGENAIAGFGIDPRNGDVLMADQDQDTIKRLVYNSTPTGQALPPTLAETGAFRDLGTLEPEPGVVPYDVDVAFWSDGALKQRWFSLPDTNLTFGFAQLGNWSLPTGSVWVKHFALRTNDAPEAIRRLETRFIVRNQGGVYGVTYRWDDSQTNATLVGEEGLDEAIAIQEGSVIRTQVWRYPSRSECLACHTAAGGFALSFNTPQLNRRHTYPNGAANQLHAMAQAGYLNGPVPDPHVLPALAPASDTNASLSFRVRSYLAANCAQCHQPTGGAVGFWDARFTEPADLSRIVDVALSNSRGDASNRVVAPGDVMHSELLRRISVRGPGQMPPIATRELDLEAIALLSTWITNSLVGYQAPTNTYVNWARENFIDPQAALAQPQTDADKDGLRNVDEYLYGFDPEDPASAWRIIPYVSAGDFRLLFPPLPNRGGEIRLEQAPVLPGPWQRVGLGPTAFFGDEEWISVGPPDGGSGFYRARLLEP